MGISLNLKLEKLRITCMVFLQMHGSIHMTGNPAEKEDLNNEDTEINRGVELVLRNKKSRK